jgi:hypothetical protein
MTLHLQPVKVGTGSADQEGQLVFKGGFLIAVLVQLSDYHEHDTGKWFLEADFGQIDVVVKPVFDSLDVAQEWIERRLSSD